MKKAIAIENATLAFKVRPIRSLEEDVISCASIVWRIVLMGHYWVDHHNLMLLMVMQVVHNVLHPQQGKSLRVKGENLAEIHVVNVGPHRLERDICSAVVHDDFCQHQIVLIAIFSLVKLYGG
jgi:hypothetical protein